MMFWIVWARLAPMPYESDRAPTFRVPDGAVRLVAALDSTPLEGRLSHVTYAHERIDVDLIYPSRTPEPRLVRDALNVYDAVFRRTEAEELWLRVLERHAGGDIVRLAIVVPRPKRLPRIPDGPLDRRALEGLLGPEAEITWGADS
ncbi:MAG: hypothetical protein IMW86_03760 [Hydrogenibacillus sp.]|nr:hypothetical protein [Hydrogenibacillus sp.]